MKLYNMEVNNPPKKKKKKNIAKDLSYYDFRNFLEGFLSKQSSTDS